MNESVPISALQHFAFCPRQCAYIHIERAWDANYLTAQGTDLHERVHSNAIETRKSIRTERGVQVCSDQLGINGQLDLLEIEEHPLKLTPVEYKRGMPKVSHCDRVQLCAQSLCLEEMRGIQIDRAALWYWKVRKREWVEIDSELRKLTEDIISRTRLLFESGRLPLANYMTGCKSCSFFDRCMPKLKDQSARYVQEMFRCNEKAPE